MCVAIYVPANVETPSLEILKKCWDANPDGAGFAIRKKSSDGKFNIEIHKGFMKWKKFEEAFKKYALDKYNEDLLLHFRITSKGTTCKGNTHPFPFTDNVQSLQSTSIKVNYAMIHNGTMPITPEVKDISDTMELAMRIYKGKFYKDIDSFLHLLDGFIGTSKLAIMDYKTVHLLGDWKTENGVYYSNLNWQYSYKSCSYNGRNYGYTWNSWYGDDDDGCADYWEDKKDKKKEDDKKSEYDYEDASYIDLDYIEACLQGGMCPHCEKFDLEWDFTKGTVECPHCKAKYEIQFDEENNVEVLDVLN